MNTQKTHEFKVVVFEDKAGLRFVHCDQAYAAISGPGETDTVIAEFSNAEFPAVAINAEMLQALTSAQIAMSNIGMQDYLIDYQGCRAAGKLVAAAIAHATGAAS